MMSNSSNRFLYKPLLGSIETEIETFRTMPESNPLTVCKSKSVLLIYDSHLPLKIVKAISLLISDVATKLHVFSLLYGKKNLSRVTQIWNQIGQNKPDIVIALGGGVTCDLVGFATSCFQRGLNHILIPTTLLSMIDVCVGGKTGIDYKGTKNQIGSYHYPIYTLNILDFLDSLPKEEYLSGFAELIKVAMLIDRDLFYKISQNHASLFQKNYDSLYEIAVKGIANKGSVITSSNANARMSLLYGHNIGHAVETLSINKRRRHGDCVSIGMNIESAIGVILGLFDKDIWKEQNILLRSLSLPTIPDCEDFERLFNNMNKYKLSRETEFIFSLPKSIGNTQVNSPNFPIMIPKKKFRKLWDEALAFAKKEE